ncbi:MAG: WbqC family protein [Rubrivivax sp.]
MRLAIMQPYFVPYIGYFQLIGAVDLFVVYDDIKYTKKGWINRNRFLLDGHEETFTLALRRGSDSLSVVERELAPDFDPLQMLDRFAAAYRRAPYREPTMDLLRRVMLCGESNLFRYVHHSLLEVCAHLGIGTEIRVSSSVRFDNSLKAEEKVLALCEAVGASSYVNPIGGTELYSRDTFAARDVELRFLRSCPVEYPQLGHPFVPWLSIVDVLMFNPVEAVRERIARDYELH